MSAESKNPFKHTLEDVLERVKLFADAAAIVAADVMLARTAFWLAGQGRSMATVTPEELKAGKAMLSGGTPTTLFLLGLGDPTLLARSVIADYASELDITTASSLLHLYVAARGATLQEIVKGSPFATDFILSYEEMEQLEGSEEKILRYFLHAAYGH